MLLGLMQDVPLTLGLIRERVETLHRAKTVTSRSPAGVVTVATYGEVLVRAGRLANALRRLGVGRGDRVATLAWNHQRHLEAYLAVPCMGAVLHTVNVRLPPATIGELVAHADDRVLLVDRSLLPVWRAAPRPPGLAHVVVIDDGEGDPALPDYDALLAREAEGHPWPALDEGEAAGLCYTSGTTGRPKGVLYSHRSSLLHAMSCLLADGIGLRERDVCMPVVPMFHANGWGFPHAALLAGASLAFSARNADPATLAEMIGRAGVTLATAVPTVWLNLLREVAAGRIDRARLASLRSLPVGGAAAPRALIEGFGALGIDVVHCWGMTEISPLALVNVRKSTLDDDAAAAARLTQGLPLPLCALRATDAEGRAVANDGASAGELEVSSPWAAARYHDMDDESAFRVDPDGRRWLRTGDVATIDPDGYVRIVDRAKDLIKSGGEWISSIDMEAWAAEHPGVAEAAVVGVPDPVWQERPVAFVAGTDLDPAAIRRHLAERFAGWQLPDRIVVLDALPKGATGKVDKRALRAAAG